MPFQRQKVTRVHLFMGMTLVGLVPALPVSRKVGRKVAKVWITGICTAMMWFLVGDANVFNPGACCREYAGGEAP